MLYKRLALFIVLIMLLGLLPLTVLAQETLDVSETYDEVAGAEPMYDVIEEVVTFENEGEAVVGTLTAPDAEGPFPMVLLFHGFTGTRDELPVMNTEEGMFSRTARILSEQGYATLRIDFRGSGESEGAWEDTTFSGQISDAFAALDYVESLEIVDPEQIAVIGLSQGGLVSSVLAANDERVASLVLWSPVANPPSTYATILGAETIQAGLQSGGEPVDIVLPWAEIQLKTGFFEDLYDIDPIAEITYYTNPMMVIVGERDDIVTPQPYYGQLYINYHEGLQDLIVLDGDHIFDVLATGPEVLDEAIYWSLAWLEETL